MDNGYQPVGYVYGTGDQFPRVGPKDKFHWRVESGIVHPHWELYRGNRKVGLELFATHESIDVPDILYQTLEGLNAGWVDEKEA